MDSLPGSGAFGTASNGDSQRGAKTPLDPPGAGEVIDADRRAALLSAGETVEMGVVGIRFEAGSSLVRKELLISRDELSRADV